MIIKRRISPLAKKNVQICPCKLQKKIEIWDCQLSNNDTFSLDRGGYFRHWNALDRPILAHFLSRFHCLQGTYLMYLKSNEGDHGKNPKSGKENRPILCDFLSLQSCLKFCCNLWLWQMTDYRGYHLKSPPFLGEFGCRVNIGLYEKYFKIAISR